MLLTGISTKGRTIDKQLYWNYQLERTEYSEVRLFLEVMPNITFLESARYLIVILFPYDLIISCL